MAGILSNVIVRITAFRSPKPKQTAFRSPKPKQTTFVYCPACRLEQIANDCFVSDDEFVEYRCSLCGTGTRWDFDAPTPLLRYWRPGFEWLVYP